MNRPSTLDPADDGRIPTEDELIALETACADFEASYDEWLERGLQRFFVEGLYVTLETKCRTLGWNGQGDAAEFARQMVGDAAAPRKAVAA